MKAPVSLVRGDGHLGAPGRNPDGAPPRPLREALRELGYVEGKNIVYEARLAEGMFERLPELAGELVRLNVDVIVAQGGKATEAARRATTLHRSDAQGRQAGGSAGGPADALLPGGQSQDGDHAGIDDSADATASGRSARRVRRVTIDEVSYPMCCRKNSIVR